MKRLGWIVPCLLLAVVVFLVLKLFPASRQTGRPQTKSQSGLQDNDHAPPGQQAKDADKHMVADFPSVSQMNLNNIIIDGKYCCSWFHNNIRFEGWSHMPVGTPAVQLRFRQRHVDGKLGPCPVWDICYVGRFDGARVVDMRTFEIGSVICHDNANANVPYSHAAVVPLVEDYPGEHSAWVMGETYLMQFVYLKNGKKKQNSRLVKIPDHVPEGKIAVIDVIVTKKLDRWWKQPQMLSVRVRQDILAPHLSLHVWNAEGSGGHPERLHLNSNGRAKIKLDQLGGDLRLANTKLPPPPAMQHRKFAFPVWYVKSITDRKITLPDDADIVIKPENAITSRLKLPTTKVPDGAVAIGLLADKDSHLSLAHARFQRDPTGIVELSCAPGMYRVVAYGPNSSAWGKPNAMRRVSDLLDPDDGVTDLGTVNITESDAGKTLEVQPAGK